MDWDPSRPNSIITGHVRAQRGTPLSQWMDNECVWDIGISIILVLFAGFASGMTVGLLSIDPIQLRVLKESGTEQEKKHAERLGSVLRQHHLLLVTLLLANSIAMEALPLFLNKTVPEWAAILLSVSAILLFGEIIPQALCTGKWQISLVMKGLPIVDVLLSLFYCLSWPIAKLLDALLGHNNQTYYARSHLKALIRLHQREKRTQLVEGPNNTQNASINELDSALGADEVVIIEGALDLAKKTTEGIMVKMENVYMLEWKTPVTGEIRKEILEKGHSRVPVYKNYRHNIKGLLLVKTLICQDWKTTPQVGDLLQKRRPPPIFCSPDTHLYDLLNEFQRGRHMTFITRQPDYYRANWGNDIPQYLDKSFDLLGIATLEDVIEELIQEEIYDEFDHYTLPLPITSKSIDVSLVSDYRRSMLLSSQRGPRSGDLIRAEAGVRKQQGPPGIIKISDNKFNTPAQTTELNGLTVHSDLSERLLEDDLHLSDTASPPTQPTSSK